MFDQDNNMCNKGFIPENCHIQKILMNILSNITEITFKHIEWFKCSGILPIYKLFPIFKQKLVKIHITLNFILYGVANTLFFFFGGSTYSNSINPRKFTDKEAHHLSYLLLIVLFPSCIFIVTAQLNLNMS